MKILFIYNANSGFMNAIIDIGHRTFKPNTNDCPLCGLTFGAMGMKRQWKKFISSLPLETEFLHRDQFSKRYPKMKVSLPYIVEENKGKLTELVTASEFKQIDSLDQLIERVNQAVKDKLQ